jgi:hypothetical protein
MFKMSVPASAASGAQGALMEPEMESYTNPNKRHITSQLWKRNDTLAMKNGLHASIKFVTGDAYLGEWRANKPHGQGTLTYRSGNKIEGEPFAAIHCIIVCSCLIFVQASLPTEFPMGLGRTG